MRLYKITASNPSGTSAELPDSETVWVGSKAEGVTARKKMADDGWKRKEIDEVETEVPTDKAGLLAFLNANVR
jgi:hypothetical protein